jgi:hypothetical protein
MWLSLFLCSEAHVFGRAVLTAAGVFGKRRAGARIFLVKKRSVPGFVRGKASLRKNDVDGAAAHFCLITLQCSFVLGSRFCLREEKGSS